MSIPRISVISPSYQQSEFLRETINSVLNQKYAELEYIIIDGGSTDGSAELIQEYANHLTYWVSEKDNGQSHAINKGLARASGQILTWLNSDDLFASGVLESIYPIFDPETGVVYGDTEIMMPNGDREIRKAADSNFNSQMIAGMPFSQPSSFFNGEIFREKGLLINESLHFGMDYYLFLQFLGVSEFKYCPGVLSYYRIHPESKSANDFAGFASEWALIYRSFLIAIGTTVSGIIKQVDQLFPELADQVTLPFSIEKKFTQQDLELSLYYFLSNQIKFRYADLELRKVRKLLKTVKQLFPLEYKDSNHPKLFFRTYLPSSLLALLRARNNQD